MDAVPTPVGARPGNRSIWATMRKDHGARVDPQDARIHLMEMYRYGHGHTPRRSSNPWTGGPAWYGDRGEPFGLPEERHDEGNEA